MRPRPDSLLGLVHQHARSESGNAEADALERALEQQVVLVAITATPLRDELLLQRLDVERHRPAQQRIQILEGDCLRMQAMNLA